MIETIKSQMIKYIEEFNKLNSNLLTIDFSSVVKETPNKRYIIELVCTPTQLFIMNSFINSTVFPIIRIPNFDYCPHFNSFANSNNLILPPITTNPSAHLLEGVIISNIKSYCVQESEITEEVFTSLLKKRDASTIFSSVDYINKIYPIKNLLTPGLNKLSSFVINEISAILTSTASYRLCSDDILFYNLIKNSMKVISYYYMVKNYSETGIFSSELSEEQQNNINAIGISNHPWDFITKCREDCANYIDNYVEKTDSKSERDLVNLVLINYIIDKSQDPIKVITPQ